MFNESQRAKKCPVCRRKVSGCSFKRKLVYERSRCLESVNELLHPPVNFNYSFYWAFESVKMVFSHYSQRSYGFSMTKSAVLIRNRYQEFVKRPESFSLINVFIFR